MTEETKIGQKFPVLRFLTFGVFWRLPRSSAMEADVWRIELRDSSSAVRAGDS